MIANLLTIVAPWLIILLVVFGVVLGTVAYLIRLERKVASWVQDRIGPNRVGPRGMLQPVADGIKMFAKEDFRSSSTDKWLFSLAPMLMMLVVIVALAVIPWGGIFQGSRTFTAATAQQASTQAADLIPLGAKVINVLPAANAGDYVVTYRFAFQIADLNLGVLFILAVLSMAVYAVVLGGWASNNKFSFFGAMRAAAQMISYEVPLGLSVITIVLMFGTLSLADITAAQAHMWKGIIPAWNIFCQPLAFLMFLICLHAEANRAPFDLAECEQELVGGYHTEYASMRLGLLLMGEYVEMFVTSAVLVALFLGGWHLPGLTGNADPSNPAITTSLVEILIRCGVYFAKILFVIGVFMWVRWSLPRFRYDQLMNLAWRALVPISLCFMLSTAVVVYYQHYRQDGRIIITAREALILLVVNLALVAVFALTSRLMPRLQVNRRVPIPGSRFGNAPAVVGRS